MQKNKPTGFSLPRDLVQRIDAERGDVPRSRYLLRILEKIYCTGKLITQMRVAKTQDNGNLDKTNSNMTFDLFDAFRLSIIRYTEDAIEVIR